MSVRTHVRGHGIGCQAVCTPYTIWRQTYKRVRGIPFTIVGICQRYIIDHFIKHICQEEDEKISSDSYGILNVKSKLFKNQKHDTNFTT